MARSGLRSSTRGRTTRNKKSTGWSGSYRDRMQIPKAEATDVLLLKGKYVDDSDEALAENNGEPIELPHHEHNAHPMKVVLPGGRYPVYRQPPCNGPGCYACKKSKQGDSRLEGQQPKTFYSINCLHLSIFEKVHIEDKDGKLLYYGETTKFHKEGDPICGWEEVTGRKSRKAAIADLDTLLDDEDIGGIKLAQKRYLILGSGHMMNLEDIEKVVGKSCFCGGHLEVVAFMCPKCGEVLVDVEDADMDAEAVDAYEEERHRCGACGHIGLPEVETVCDECQDPDPLTIFDVVLKLRKKGEGAQTVIDCEGFVPIAEYEFPNGEMLTELDADGEPQFEEDGTPVWSERVKKMAENQFDFDNSVHKPMTNDELKELLDGPTDDAPSGNRSSGRRRASKYRK
jgi:hypothetical protein